MTREVGILDFSIINILYSGNTTNMRVHMDNYHKNLGDNVSKRLPTPKQLKLATCIQAGSLEKRMCAKKKGQIDDSLDKLLVMEVLPLSLVENEHFQKFVKLLDTR